MKEDLHAACQRVDPTQVGSLAKVATMACQREIIDVIRTAMLPGNDVLDVM
jgi:hypothetical protein